MLNFLEVKVSRFQEHRGSFKFERGPSFDLDFGVLVLGRICLWSGEIRDCSYLWYVRWGKGGK